MKKLTTSIVFILIVPIAHFLLALLAPSLVQLKFAHILLIYGILATLTLVHLFVVKRIVHSHKEQSPIIIMALNMVKMIASLVLLFVIVVPQAGKGGAVALNFAAAYFTFLIFDSQMVVLMLTDKEQ